MMKYLNSKFYELESGAEITYRGKVYWMNTWTNEIYAMSLDEYILGGLYGYKVADVLPGCQIVKAN